MGKGLQAQLSSAYFKAANKMTPKNAKRRIVAYVESYDDIYFWRTVLGHFENKEQCFEIVLPSRDNKLGRGKKAALMALIGEKVGENMIACVDADYDYLLQGATPLSKTIIENPYIFHTYAYSIENLQCYAGGLHELCVAATLNDKAVFDFNAFLEQFSQIIFPLFVWNIWHYRTGHYQEFTLTDFNRIIEVGRFSLNQTDEALQHLERKVRRKIAQLQHRHPYSANSYSNIEADLRRLGVVPNETYLYIQGHHLLDTIVMPMLTRVCDYLVRAQENQIRRQSVHNTQMRNELASYNHSLADLLPMLKKSKTYVDAEPFQRIRQDLRSFIEQTFRENS